MFSPPTLGPWALDLGPSASRTILLITTGIIFGKDIRECTEDLEGFGIASDEVVSQMQCRKDFGGCGRTSEDMGPIVRGLQKEWYVLQMGFKCFRTVENCLR